MIKRLFIVMGLSLFAVGWVFLMALGISRGSNKEGGTPRSGAAPWTDDGKVKAEIASLQRNDFHLTLNAKVAGPDGKLIGGLAESDFEVTEDGEPVALTKFVPAGQAPIRVCVCIDFSNSMRQAGKIEGARKAALAMVDMLRDHTDYLGLFFFNGQLARTNSMERVSLRVLDAERRQMAKQAIEKTPLGGGTPMYQAMDHAFAKMKAVTGRRVMIVLTDGLDTTAKGAAKEQRIKTLGEASSKNSIPVYMITVGGGKIDEAGMKKMADAGHGRYFHAPTGDQLKAIFVSIGKTLQNEYVLEWDSPNAFEDGSNRKVVVTARHGPSGTQVRTAYDVPGVIATGAAKRPAKAHAAGTSGESGDASESPSAPVMSVFWPLGTVLALAFAVPYFFWLRSRPRSRTGSR